MGFLGVARRSRNPDRDSLAGGRAETLVERTGRSGVAGALARVGAPVRCAADEARFGVAALLLPADCASVGSMWRAVVFFFLSFVLVSTDCGSSGGTATTGTGGGGGKVVASRDGSFDAAMTDAVAVTTVVAVLASRDTLRASSPTRRMTALSFTIAAIQSDQRTQGAKLSRSKSGDASRSRTEGLSHGSVAIMRLAVATRYGAAL